MSWHSLPLFMRVEGRPVILLGEGEAADAKRRLLERAGALVVTDHPDARLAIVAIEDEADAVAAVERLRARGLLVNAVDRPGLCDFTLPAIVDRAPVLVAIGTGGVSAGLAAALRQRLEALLPSGLGRLATALQGSRARLRALYPDASERRRAIGTALSEALDPLVEQPTEAVERWLTETERGLATSFPGGGRSSAGSVVEGASNQPQGAALDPGLRRGSTEEGGERTAIFHLSSPDPDDLTLRQARLLANADRVFHTLAVPAAILDRARADAARIVAPAPPVGWEPGVTVWLEMA